MKKAVAIRHVCFEDLGIFEPALEQYGYAVEYIDATNGDFASLMDHPPELLIVLGGPIGSFEQEIYPFLVSELEVIRQRLVVGLPILGICLGAQLIARALGAPVRYMGYKEIGYHLLSFTEAGSLSPLRGLAGVHVLHWHGDQFEIPDEALLLAGSDLCPHQAFSAGPNVLALQFHVEADSEKLERWLVGHAAELSAASIDPRVLREQARKLGPDLKCAGSKVLTQWLDNLQDP